MLLTLIITITLNIFLCHFNKLEYIFLASSFAVRLFIVVASVNSAEILAEAARTSWGLFQRIKSRALCAAALELLQVLTTYLQSSRRDKVKAKTLPEPYFMDSRCLRKFVLEI
jgi:hypothetical protein